MRCPLFATTTLLIFASFTMVAEEGNPKISEQIQSIWELEEKDGSKRLKYIVGGMWTITQADPETGKVIFHHGGNYTIEGDTYVETVEFANENTADLVGAKHTFRVSVKGDQLTQVGVGNPWTEAWTRVER